MSWRLLLALLILSPDPGLAQEDDWAGGLQGLGSQIQATMRDASKVKPPVPKPAARCQSANLSLQFNNLGSVTYDRNQGDIGSCHVFASVALLEAALYRKTKVRYRLSEADLFLNRTVNHPHYYEVFVGRLRAEIQAEKLDYSPQVLEGGWPSEDLEYAVANGVAKGSGKDWAEFSARYVKYKHEIDEQMFQCKLDFKYPSGPAESSDQALAGLCGNPEAALKRFSPDPAATQHRLSGGPDKAQLMLESRQESLGLLGDLTVKSYAQWQPGWPEAKKLPDILSQQLCRGVPLVIGMKMPGGGGHALVLRAFSNGLFCTRNSWSDGNDLCFDAEEIVQRLYIFSIVLTPNEAAGL